MVENKFEEVRFMIQLTHYSLKPKARSDLIYYQLSLSKYLDRSDLIIILRVSNDFKEWMISCERMTLSII
jgi:hypothetical protein